MEQPVIGKEKVNIEGIEPQGQYAVKLIFSDGHDTGIYSWDTLYDLGKNQDQYWLEYLHRLEQAGVLRSSGPGEASGPCNITLLYFNYLAQKFGKESEQLELPESVVDVRALLDWLRRRAYDKAYLLQDGSFRVTVNRQFAEPFTRIEQNDEVALVPNSPYAPSSTPST